MKKIIAIAAMLLMVISANAQFKFGVKGGLNITNMTISSDIANASNQTGFYAGVTAKFTLPILGLGMDISALYDQRSAEMSTEIFDDQNNPTTYTEKIKKNTLAIPVNFRMPIAGVGIASIYGYTGPQIAFNLGDKSVNLAGTKAWTLKDSSFSWNVGLGVMVASKVQINANYNIALGATGDQENLGDAAWNAANGALKNMFSSSHSGSWQIGAAYYF